MKHRNIKILIVIHSLMMGGAERLTVFLLKYLNHDKFDLALCLLEKKGELLDEVPKNIKIFDLKKRSRWSFFKLIFKLNKIIVEYKPDIVYTRVWYATLVIACVRFFFKKNFLLVSNEEHNSLRDILPTDPYGKLKKFFISWGYKKSDKVIVPTKGVKQEISLNYRLRKDKIDIISNSVDIFEIKNQVKEKVNHDWFKDNIPIIVGFGRLIYRKGFSDLLKAFTLVYKTIPARLILIGEGEDRQFLEKLAQKLEINKHVLFLGYQRNPFKYLAKSTIFVLPSLWEGFADVIIETLACGVPIISTRCPYGPEEIITDGLNGLLVPVGDVKAMAEAILRLIADESLKKRLAENGKKRAQDFCVERMVSKYEKLFEEIALR